MYTEQVNLGGGTVATAGSTRLETLADNLNYRLEILETLSRRVSGAGNRYFGLPPAAPSKGEEKDMVEPTCLDDKFLKLLDRFSFLLSGLEKGIERIEEAC